MKRITSWLQDIQHEIAPYFMAAMIALTVIYVFAKKITVGEVFSLSIFVLIATGAAYSAAVYYTLNPLMPSIIGGIFGGPLLSGIFKVSIEMYRNPKTVIQWFKK